MSAGPLPAYSDTQRREAADWFVEIHACTEPDIDTLHAWLRWMESVDGNRLAFESIVAVWHAAPEPLIVALPSAEELADDSYDGSMPLISWKEQTAPPESISRVVAARPPERPRRRTWPHVAIGVAASVAVFVLGAMQILHKGPSGNGEYVTKTAERLDIALSDGSHISLGAKSRLYVAFTKDRRTVQLEAGEGYFTVAKDAGRPFVVHALRTDVTAVGTAFDVRAVADRVTVVVSEGVVKVRPPTNTPTMTSALADVRVVAGQQVAIGARAALRLAVRRVCLPQ
jgi:transmembrane sensor